MSEIERYEPKAPIGGNPAHVRLSINQVGHVANLIAESGMFQNNRKNMTPAEVFSVVMAGQALGIGPVPSMMSFHVIEGRPEMSANLQAYFLKSSGKYDYRVKPLHAEDGSPYGCSIDFIDTRLGEIIGNSTFTHDDAVRAGLAGGVNYKKYPMSMYFARALSNGMAWHCPDAVPMRIYSEGEIGGRDTAVVEGVQPVAGEGPVSAPKVEAIVNAALAGDDEEVIEDAEIVEPEPQVGVDVDAELDRFTPQAIEQRLREDLPKLGEDDKVLVKEIVTASGKPWGYKSIAELVSERGYTDIHSWLRYQHEAIRGRVSEDLPRDDPEPSGTPAGVSGRATGSQTAPTVSDAQVRMLHGRFSACSFSEEEKRAFLSRYADAASTRDVKKADVDDLLRVLHDIETGDETTRRAYLEVAS